MATPHRTWVEISQRAVRHNISVIQNLIGPDVKIMPVIKANAYGHGLPEILTVIKRLNIWGVGVAYGEEALAVRAEKYRGRILALSNWQPSDLVNLMRQQVELAVWDEPSLNNLLTLSKSTQRPKIHLKLDTGTSRIGFTTNQLNLVKKIFANQRINISGIFSHFANAEEKTSTRTVEQLKRFTTLISILRLSNGGISPHIACTAAILRYPEARFGLVRLGIGLYGLWPSAEIKAWSRSNLPGFDFRPVMTWRTRIAQVKNIPPGAKIGYGSTYTAKRKTKLAILPVGYSDGYDRRWSNTGWVMINRQRAPVRGRVCMNLTMIDATDIKSVATGQVVTLLGPGVTADQLADLAATINYEITTRINSRLPRLLT